MAPLGDFFPQQDRNNYFNRTLVQGAVFRSFVNDTQPPKIKFWVVFSVLEDSDELGVIYVNTNPNNISSERANVQIKLDRGDSSIFDYDCYADCSRVYTKKISDIKELIANDMDIHRGCITTNQLGFILSAILRAETISPKVKKKFGVY